MKQFLSVNDTGDVQTLVKEALQVKANLYGDAALGKGKTIALLFMNPSLRTRMSTQKAAYNLGMNVMVVNLDKDSWQIEFEDGAVMNGNKSEHIREAAGVISHYCDIVGLRCFPGLVDRDKDYAEQILNSFIKYCTKPVISLESGTRHPLQSFADMISIAETNPIGKRPKVVLTWAPHIKALPQAVPNSFAEWAVSSGAEVVIAHPEGYELEESFSKGAKIECNQDAALKGADYVYVKNWSSYNNYGAIPHVKESWLLTNEKLKQTNNAKVMHCLPVRRNVELSDEIIDGPNSLIQLQAANRVVAAQTVLEKNIANHIVMEELFVIKIGGNIIDDATALKSFLADFYSIPGNKILVHGGGKLATELGTKLGIETKMVAGRRITDADTIRIVTMTYAGWINKSITAILQSLNCNAIGLCGADAHIIPAVKRPVKDIDYGWVGDIETDKVNTDFLKEMLSNGYTPIIAPITADANGNLLNVNADTVAQSLAQALSRIYKTTLVYCFEKEGLLQDVNNPASVIAEINMVGAEEMKRSGVIKDGMIPKTDNAFKALNCGVKSVVMGHARSLKKMLLKEKGYGTYFKP